MSDLPDEDAPAWAARKLLRAARAGTLASAIDGQPFASLVTPATAPDASILLLLSDLSEHTRHLRTDGRCALMVTGVPNGPNAQTAPRVTITGLASIDPDPALRQRWITLHPYAAFYAGFTDFNLWRIRPAGALFVGGFARAHRLVTDMTGRVERCNRDHAEDLAAVAGAGWRMVACDVDGCDVAHEDTVRRLHWTAPAGSPDGMESALAHLLRTVRNEHEPAVDETGSGPL